MVPGVAGDPVVGGHVPVEGEENHAGHGAAKVVGRNCQGLGGVEDLKDKRPKRQKTTKKLKDLKDKRPKRQNN